MKLSFMIAILKQADADPSLLLKKMRFEKQSEMNFKQNIKIFSLENGKEYTIRELLYDMIVYSDNDALDLISKNVDAKVYFKIFTDFHISPPPLNPKGSIEYKMNVKDYGKFFRALYSSAYLLDQHSEFALHLLSQSEYKDGFLNLIKPDFPVVHKFGEYQDDTSTQLHEFGIFYADPQPYLLGVMTKGKNLSHLAKVLAQISLAVYEHRSQY